MSPSPQHNLTLEAIKVAGKIWQRSRRSAAGSCIHLFQKTLSESTANGNCRTEIARPKGTVVSISMSSLRGAKLGSLSNHDDDSYTNPTNLHI